MSGRKGKRALSPEETALWRAVANTVRREPSRPAPEQKAAPDAKPDPSLGAPARSAAHPPPPIPQKRLHPPSSSKAHRRPNAPSPAKPPLAVRDLNPSTPGLDRRTSRRLRRGEIAPDARLDLHGMTMARAHSALTSFILHHAARGGRMVLVITGKGGRDHKNAGHLIRPVEPGAGVLKTMTPAWLGEPPLRDHVIGVYPAHISHGGAGAYYVYLKRWK